MSAATALQLAESLCDQVKVDLAVAHGEICKLQSLDPEKHGWPEWSSPANTLRWIETEILPAIRAALSAPVNEWEMPEVAAMRYIEQLRADEGDGVTIYCDDPEAIARDCQMAIDCIGAWTGWRDRRFYGESVVQCLAKAVQARQALDA